MYRQGDVLLIPTPHLPCDAQLLQRDDGRVVLAYGEVTGHAHAIDAPDAELWSLADEVDRYLRLRSRARLQHEEHATLVLEPGCYRVVRQREYAPDAVRNVAD